MRDTLWVWDLDGTALDSRHRDRFFNAGDIEAAWSYDNVCKDTPTDWVLEHDLWRNGQFRYGRYCYLTARHEDTRRATEDNLRSHGMLAEGVLVIMKDTPTSKYPGHEPVHYFKARHLLTLARFHSDTHIIFVDDDDRVLETAWGLKHPHIEVRDSLQRKDWIREHAGRW